MKRLFFPLLVLLLAGCGGASISQLASQRAGQSVAVVSVSVNDFGGSLQGWNKTSTSDLMSSNAAQMVHMAETELGRHWQVVPAPQFVGQPGYQELAGAHFEVAVPRIEGTVMPVFAETRKELIRASMPPGKAQQLARGIGVDLIAVVYAEWGVATGGFVPTSKALSKNVLSIYDASGQRVYHGRKDTRGNKTLGAFGHVVVDENSIGEWVGAYQEGLAILAGS
ncbi:MAG: hypothetical protein ACODAU_04665 [Myxococcota bacterium]